MARTRNRNKLARLGKCERREIRKVTSHWSAQSNVFATIENEAELTDRVRIMGLPPGGCSEPFCAMPDIRMVFMPDWLINANNHIWSLSRVPIKHRKVTYGEWKEVVL